MHVKQMHAHAGTTPASLRGLSLGEYLDRGVDEFFIERQFDNWAANPDPKHPTIIIRYELLGEHIEEVLDFFACRQSFVLKARRTSWRDEPAHIRKGLERIYGRLNEKIESMPGIRILGPVRPRSAGAA
jgi:hypothetical protein